MRFDRHVEKVFDVIQNARKLASAHNLVELMSVLPELKRAVKTLDRIESGKKKPKKKANV